MVLNLRGSTFHVHFLLKIADMASSQWSLIDKNETCGIMTLDPARHVGLDSAGVYTLLWQPL